MTNFPRPAVKSCVQAVFTDDARAHADAHCQMDDGIAMILAATKNEFRQCPRVGIIDDGDVNFRHVLLDKTLVQHVNQIDVLPTNVRQINHMTIQSIDQTWHRYAQTQHVMV